MPFEAATRDQRFWAGGISAIAEVIRHRELLGLLTRRDLKSRYKDSAGGFLWSLARPLTQLLIYYLVIGEFLNAARVIDNFAIYVFAGLSLYTLFSEIVSGATSSVVSNSGLVKKVYLPREIFPLATVGAALVNFAIQVGLLIVAAALIGTLSWGPHLLWSLAGFALVMIFAVAIGLALSAINVYLRDVQYFVEVALMLMMWASPIVYPWAAATNVFGGWLAEVYLNNPVTLSVIAFQHAFWDPSAPLPDDFGLRMLIAGLVGLVLLWFAQRIFIRLEGDFAQEL
ncbi:MAG: ABC transporter permease [Microbacteriaceae bacterium]|nr:ABC transporter permease [Microbacteriaceae bacterium]